MSKVDGLSLLLEIFELLEGLKACHLGNLRIRHLSDIASSKFGDDVAR